MLFNSLSYALFLPIIVSLYWILPARFRKPLLLCSSYVFYMAWLPQYGLLILGLTIVNYLFGRWLAAAQHKRQILLCALIANLGTLTFFKYALFLCESAEVVLGVFRLALPTSWARQIILPLGISFFTFEFIHYLVDVYHGGKPISSLVDFALFPAFFPTQIAGPIKRYQDFVPQLAKLPAWDRDRFQQGCGLVLRGLFKKMILADTLSVTVTMGFNSFQRLAVADTWITVLAFAFEIYFDFSGYTDIGRGSAQLMGFSVPINFSLPYLASNISEFWRRWHITLSQWLRDYLFIPMGGSRGSRRETYRNLFITMALGGLWHGAAWTYVVWGMYHGLLLVLHREEQRLTKNWVGFNQFKQGSIGQVVSIGVTFLLVCVGWVFFRAPTIDQAWSMILRMLAIHTTWIGSAIGETKILEVGLVILGYAASVWLFQWLDKQQRWPSLRHNRWILDSTFYAGLIIGLVILRPQVSRAFIYFQF